VKKVIMILGYIFLALIIVFLAGFGSLTVIGNRLDKESKAFVDAAIPAIVSTWDVSEIEKRASPEFTDDVDYDGLVQDFGVLQQLGNLVMYKGSSGDAHITLLSDMAMKLPLITPRARILKRVQRVCRCLLSNTGANGRYLSLQ
jgi:hypothetical protein